MISKIINDFNDIRHDYFNYLFLYTIYYNTKDFPNKYVARLWFTKDGEVNPTEYCTVKDTLEESRASIPSGTYKFPRAEQDDDVILETWI